MCGIAGWVAVSPIEAAEAMHLCSNLAGGLAHRGPDDAGVTLMYADGRMQSYALDDTLSGLKSGMPHIRQAEGLVQAALVHRRLSIISPGVAGHQPMVSQSGRFCLAFNGEIFNFHQLDARFGIANASRTDTETLLTIWDSQRQENTMSVLDGFFAFAIWDNQEKKMHLVRDATGVKPLFYTRQNGMTCFASEARVLQKTFGLTTLNTHALTHILAEGMYLPSHGHPLTEIAEVPPFSRLWIEAKNGQTNSDVWTRETHVIPGLLREELIHATQSRLMADVPLGFAVSGGIDSAALIGIARFVLGEEHPLKLFSVTSADPDSDESEWQKKVVDFTRGEWHSVSISEAGPELLQEVVQSTGLIPVAWNNLAHFQLCRLVRQQGVTVLFNGQGADEIFGGYPDYLQRDWANMPFYLWQNRNKLPLTQTEIIKGWFRMKLKSAGPASSFLRRKRVEGWLHPDLHTYEPLHWQQAHLSAFHAMHADYWGQKLGQMLLWEDANGMAHSLESRNPFADDPRLASWLQISFQDKMTNGYMKGALRNAAKPFVPPDVLWRVDKKGFTVPDAALSSRVMMAWKPAFMDSSLEPWSPAAMREKQWSSIESGDPVALRWFFRLTAFSYYLQQLRS
ncbi:MAG: asparagine synthase (glutamine-hydrolyzing) [Bacteroidetes bacterium]|nr:asparagine synthase (glutamine-hydrolyzing) [Bacteroidota bacterium]